MRRAGWPGASQDAPGRPMERSMNRRWDWQVWRQPLVQLALSLLAYLAFGYWLGEVAFVVAAPIFAAVATSPLMELLIQWRRQFRESVWLPVHGRHFAFADLAVGVFDDLRGHRWIKLSDARRLVAAVPVDTVLHNTCPTGVAMLGDPPSLHMRVDALIDLLDRMNGRRALRFKLWLRDDVAFPAARKRERARKVDPD